MNFKSRLCAMNCHYRFYELEEFFRHAHINGIKYVELWTGPMHFFVDYNQHDDVEILKLLSEKYKIKIIGLCPEQTNPKPNNIAVKSVIGKQNVYKYYKQIIDIADKIGCKQVLVTSGWAYYNEPIEDAWNRSVSMMKRIAEYSKKKDIMLVLEALQIDESLLVNSVNDIKRYREDVNSGNLKVCIDFGAMSRAQNTIEEYFETFGDDVRHIHFVDGKPTGHLAWSDGDRDLEKDLNDLQRYNYNGFLSLETATQRYYEKPWIAEEKTISTFEKLEGEKDETLYIS
ncbi:sugar phosphate isomerase/epimerase family protein [Clostridium cadaveris]|uniref:sugar phosphate isomerase/epimerase family protein n=1 Tax=Clostridium cadaveris TaxID=1529 RepID=UPI0003FE0AD1|nr:TIM barrel protein [Clostridium cadaveris]NWK09743.1 TIM barrel protein [Clostridium cadaveris]